MKRKTVDAILEKVGIKPFADSDPRYSEPLSITFLSQAAFPMATFPTPSSASSTSPRPTVSRPMPEQIEANRQYNLSRLAEFDHKAAAVRLKQAAEANLEAARVRHMLAENSESDQFE